MKVTIYDDGINIFIQKRELKLAIRDHFTLQSFKDFIIDGIFDELQKEKMERSKADE